MNKIFLLLLNLMVATANAENNSINLSQNETLVQMLDIDLDSDGYKDKLVITENNSLKKDKGYLLTIFNADKFGNYKKVGINSYIFACIPCIHTEKVLYADNINTKKANHFSMYIENMNNNATFTFEKIHTGQWHLVDFQSSYVNSNGKRIVKKKSYPANYGMIYFDKFNPDLFY